MFWTVCVYDASCFCQCVVLLILSNFRVIGTEFLPVKRQQCVSFSDFSSAFVSVFVNSVMCKLVYSVIPSVF